MSWCSTCGMDFDEADDEEKCVRCGAPLCAECHEEDEGLCDGCKPDDWEEST